MMKTCTKCGIEQPENEYYVSKGGRAAMCRTCSLARQTSPEVRAMRKLTRPKKAKVRVCWWSGKEFEPSKEQGKAGRKTSPESDEEQTAIFGKPLTASITANVHHAKVRAEKRGLPFNITTEYIYSIIPKDGICPVFKVPMRVNSPYALSMDKIIPEKGYVVGNVQIISLKANMMKQDATPAELIQFSKYIQKEFNHG